jgi:predicted dehydrogenase
MIDLGAHGMYLTHWILGEPSGYKSAFEHFCRDAEDALLNPDGIEDNAVTVMTYPSGAIAINETGFVSRGCATTLEVGGVDGYIYQDGGKYMLRNRDGARELEISEDLPKPIVFFMKGETPEGCGLDEATALTRMMIGAYKNA